MTDRDKLKDILKIFKANMLDEDQTIFAIQKVRFHNFYAIPEKDFIEISNLLRIAKSIAPQNTEYYDRLNKIPLLNNKQGEQSCY